MCNLGNPTRASGLRLVGLTLEAHGPHVTACSLPLYSQVGPLLRAQSLSSILTSMICLATTCEGSWEQVVQGDRGN